MTFCDNCAEELQDALCLPFAKLPFDVASACKGESGVVCEECFTDLICTNKEE